MNTNNTVVLRFSAAYMAFLVVTSAYSATNYVSLSGTNNYPYTDWAGAATQIQWAVDAASDGNTVLVSNGTYYLTNQISVTKAITLQSVNGRDATIVDGNYPNVTTRCVYIRLTAPSKATFAGFTVRNGYTNNSEGGGIRCYNGYVQNCRISANTCSNSYGGGIWVAYGTVSNCEIIGNSNINYHGGGTCGEIDASIVNCVIVSNTVTNTLAQEARAGGIMANGSAVIVDQCNIRDNLVSTAAGNALGGGVELRSGAVLRNSFVYSNRAKKGAGIFVYYSWGKIQNCTVVSNAASVAGGGITIACAATSTTYVENTISFLNTVPAGETTSNIYSYLTETYTGTYNIVNSCIAPTKDFKTNGIVGYYYAGNTDADPRFANIDNNNFRLGQNSPCINSGTNQDWMTNAVDLDGRTRIRYGVVDMGAFERINSGTIYLAH